MDKLPLTINGKLDRKALPDPILGSDTESYTAPRNDLETRLCTIFAEVLGLEVSKVGINDTFFKLGGNSILAIKVVSKINLYYQSHLKIVDIFTYKNIELLANRLVQTKGKYQTIVKLNNSQNKSNMFMIHPGSGGCEVYVSLAAKLANDFSCYGIDSYNLYTKNKITSLHKLAQYYLSYIEEIMEKTKQKDFYLLGWSLGGQIALEIASILEQKGYKNIIVYLLDTAIRDKKNKEIIGDVDMQSRTVKIREYMMQAKYEISYIDKIISNLETESNFSTQRIFSTIEHARVLLFKAMLEDTRFQLEGNNLKKHKSILNSSYNNLDKVVCSINQIEIVKMFKFHHGNILEGEEIIVDKIRRQLKMN